MQAQQSPLILLLMDTSPTIAGQARARLARAQHAHEEAVARVAAFFRSPEWLAAAAEERRTTAESQAAQDALARAEAGAS
jgi:hypothetical protein